MTRRENLLRAARFQQPEYIPVHFVINSACWHHYPPAALYDLMAAHPFLFPGFQRPAEEKPREYARWARAGQPGVDAWGCTHETGDDGLTGVVTRHPLEDWAAFDALPSPDPATQGLWAPRDWAKTADRMARLKAQGELAGGSLEHGHTFLTLCNIRGYQNLLCDMADDEPRLWPLIERVERYNLGVVERSVASGAEWMGYPEDLGMQIGPMLSPAHFRKYIQPTYQRLMAPARAAGCVLHMHSDGDIRALLPDILACGVDVMNLQDLVNGLDWIRDHLAGRVCVDLDIDRQKITVFGTPAEIDAHVRACVTTLGSRRGGLIFTFGLYPGTPIENVRALMDAFERYAGHFA